MNSDFSSIFPTKINENNSHFPLAIDIVLTRRCESMINNKLYEKLPLCKYCYDNEDVTY